MEYQKQGLEMMKKGYVIIMLGMLEVFIIPGKTLSICLTLAAITTIIYMITR